MKFVIKHIVMFSNMKILVFDELHKTSAKLASVIKTASRILFMTLINVQNA